MTLFQMKHLTTPPSYQKKWDTIAGQDCQYRAIFYLFSDSLTWLCTAIFKAILVSSPVGGLLDFQQAQTEIKLVKLSEGGPSCDIPVVFLGLHSSLELCRVSELWEKEDQQEGEMTVKSPLRRDQTEKI